MCQSRCEEENNNLNKCSHFDGPAVLVMGDDDELGDEESDGCTIALLQLVSSIPLNGLGLTS